MEMKLGILTKLLDFLDKNQSQLSLKEITQHFLGLTILYTKLEEYNDGCVWLADFQKEYLKDLFRDFSESSAIFQLRAIEKETLKKLDYHINIQIRPLGRFCILNVNKNCIDALFSEANHLEGTNKNDFLKRLRFAFKSPNRIPLSIFPPETIPTLNQEPKPSQSDRFSNTT